MDEIVSVIIPIYNIEEYLIECIESVLNQTYQNLEIILIDDGSTDCSEHLCDVYKNRDERIRVYHTENEGLVATRKAGLREATGNYIWFIDGDDYAEPDMLEHMINLLHIYDVDFVHTGLYQDDQCTIMGCPMEAQKYDLDRKTKMYILSNLVFRQNAGGISPSICSKLYKKELIQKSYQAVPNYQSYGEDMINLYMSILCANSVYIDNSAYYHYRTRQHSISRRKDIDVVIECGGMINILEKLCRKYNFLSLIADIQQHYKRWILNYLKKEMDIELNVYEFPNIRDIEHKRIILYGAGAVGKDFYSQIAKYENCNIVAWVDKASVEIPYRKIDDIHVVSYMDYDYILIAVKREYMAKEIRQELVALGVEPEKIMWIAPKCKDEL